MRIPVTLVTGFLGSGKTTLINIALKAREFSKTLVIVNEFGEVGLDHQLFASSNDAVVVLENGCLCCTVRSDLVSTLNSLYHDQRAGRIPAFDRVVIETSGLAEPGSVLQAFLSEPTLDGLFQVACVVTLVDAVNWRDTVEAHDEAMRQVALADRIAITKLDLVSGDRGVAEATLVAELAEINPAAAISIMDSSTTAVASLLSSIGFDAADPSANPLPWLGIDRYEARRRAIDGQDADHHHHTHEGIESFVLTRKEPLSRQELQFLLDGITQNLGTGLLRVKGLVNVADEPGKPAVIQGAQHLLHTTTWLAKWPDADQNSRIVFITQGIAYARLKELIELLDRMSERTFKARERGKLAQEAAKNEKKSQQ